MTDLLGLEETGAELRALALAAAPAVHAPPDLADQALARPNGSRRRRAVVGLGVVAAAGVLAAAAVQGLGDFKRWEMPSDAMTPTVQIGQQVVVRNGAVPQRGEVVLTQVYEVSQDRTQSFETLSRVVGVAGDTVSCPDRGDGRCDAVVVDGVPLVEPYLVGQTAFGTRTDPFAPTTVGVGQLFLLGDHRQAANDSRFTGPQPTENVEGVIVAQVTPDGLQRLPGT